MTLRTTLPLLVVLLGCSAPTPATDAATDLVADAPADRALAPEAAAPDVAAPDAVVAVVADAADVLAFDAADVATHDASSPDVPSPDAPPPDDVGDVADARADVVGVTAPDFMLPDRNPNSRTHQRTVSPSAQRGSVSVWYFASAT